jgi:dTMP kinase
MSLFITFEGIEGCGKTTQIRLLAERLRQSGLEILVTREPGGCPIADAIRSILLHPDSHALVPRAELLLYAAARAQHVDEVIRPALARGTLVLCDRFIDATVAYQGGGRGLDPSLIASLNSLATDGLLPDLTLLLDMPAAEGLQRARRRNAAAPEEDRFEREALDFHCRVRNEYLQLARQQTRFMVIDASGPIEVVAERVGTAVEAVLKHKGTS